MKITSGTIKTYLRKKPGSVKHIDNLLIETGEGKPRFINLRFYWKRSGRRDTRQVASLNLSSTPTQIREADRRYQEMLGNLRMGITPWDTEASERRAKEWKEREHGYRLTVEQLFENHFEVKKPNRKPDGLRSDRQKYRNHIHPIIGRLIAEDVRRADLNLVVQRLVQAGKNTQAGIVARMLRTVWLWGFRHDPDKYPINPELAAGLDYPQIPRGERVATKAELIRILQEGSPLCKAFLYMGNRPMDTRQMGWHDFDEDDKHWLEIPKEKYKTNKAHRIYITNTVLGLIEEAQKIAPSNKWCFVGRFDDCLSKGTMYNEWCDLKLEAIIPENQNRRLQMRDVRRTFFTWIEEEYDYMLAGVVSGHVKPGMGRTYGKFEYKKDKIKIMKHWERYLNALFKQ